MSELSSDARDLVAQARKQGSELLGPSAEQRAQLREKLAPLWAAEVVQPRAARGLRWKLASLVLVAGLGLLGWFHTRPASAPPTAVGVALPPSAASGQWSPRAISADDESGAALMDRAGTHALLVHGSLTESGARGAREQCPRGSSLRAGVCTQGDALPPGELAAPQPLAAAAPRKAKRAASPLPETSPAAQRKLSSPPSAAGAATSPRDASSATPAKDLKHPGGLDAAPAKDVVRPGEEDLLAGLGLDSDETAKNGRRVQPARKDAPMRLPLKAAEERTPERAVQTDADPGPFSIDGELELLGAAQTALQKQRPSRALTLLQEHAFRFPTGAMVEERMAMQALALCALRRRHAAQTVLSDLEARGSQSQLLPRVRSQCGL
jgi:hypothetical protein